MPPVPNSNAREYLRTRKVHSLFEQLAAAVIGEQPEDPLEHIWRTAADMLVARDGALPSDAAATSLAMPSITAGSVSVDSSSESQELSVMSSGTSTPRRVAISKPLDAVVKIGREDDTTDVTAFRRMRKAAVRQRSNVCETFWDKLEHLVGELTDPVGLRELPNAFDVFPVTQEHIDRYLGRFGAVAFLLDLNPRQMATAFGVREHDVITELLAATACGMVNLKWSPVCLQCAGNTCEVCGLDALPSRVRCPVCGKGNEVAQLDDIKVVFRLHPDVLYSHRINACTVTPQVLSKYRYVAPNLVTSTGSGFLHTPPTLPAGAYRIWCPITGVDTTITVARDATSNDKRYVCELTTQQLLALNGKTFAVPHGCLEFRIWCTTGKFFMLIIVDNFEGCELARSGDDREPFTSATTVLNHPAFQKRFADQLVRPTENLCISHTVFVFTDLVESTRTYAHLGDGQALGMVQDHFATIFAAVATHEGRIVKTIGDAVMATFTTGRGAVLAMGEALAGLRLYNQSPDCPPGAEVHLRVGIHAGTALVVPVNGINDFFGQTVNIAARTEGKATADEILVTDAVRSDPDAADAMEELVATGGFVRCNAAGAMPNLAAAGGAEAWGRSLKLKGVDTCVTGYGLLLGAEDGGPLSTSR